MKMPSRSARIVVTVLATIQVVGPSALHAQTPAQMEYERQQREYARQQEQQRQEQQRLQQLMNDNARRQQEESSRINAPSGQSQAPSYPGATVRAAPQQQAAARENANVATADAKWALRGTLSDYGGVDIYSDPVTLRRSGNVARMWEMWDFKTMQVIAQKRVMSLKNLMEFDCGGSRRRLVSTTGYSAHLGQGKVVASADVTNPWEPVTGGYPQSVWKSACATK